jgi:hypothetical protein
LNIIVLVPFVLGIRMVEVVRIFQAIEVAERRSYIQGDIPSLNLCHHFDRLSFSEAPNACAFLLSRTTESLI